MFLFLITYHGQIHYILYNTYSVVLTKIEYYDIIVKCSLNNVIATMWFKLYEEYSNITLFINYF